jgi:hypothetical protein
MRGLIVGTSSNPSCLQTGLDRRYQRLAARGKPKQHVVIAIAREHSCSVWATLTQ